MRIGRTLPPAAAPIYFRDIISGFKGLIRGRRDLNRFEDELKQYFGVKHCFLVSSGKAALTLILQALKDIHPERDEVLIPAFTCYSVPSAIVRAGLKVRLCDINPDTLDFDFDQLSQVLSQYSAKAPNEPNCLPRAQRSSSPPCEIRSIFHRGEAILQPEASSNRLLAIIPAHLFGLPAEVDRLREMVVDPDVVIIEDAAQNMGAEWNGKKLGTLGDVSFFSLGRGKALSTVEGGIILTDRDDISEKIRVQMEEVPHYSNFGLLALFFNGTALSLFMRPFLFWLPKSLPFLRIGDTIYDPHFKIKRMSAFQAGLANGWQKKLRKFKKIRKRNAKQWVSLLEENHISHYCFGKIATQKTQQTQITQATELPSLIRFPVRIYDRSLKAKLLRGSNQMGLGIMFTYPDSIDGIQELRDSFKGLDFPVAKEIAHQLITLPTHLFVFQNDKEKISALISQRNSLRATPAP